MSAGVSNATQLCVCAADMVPEAGPEVEGLKPEAADEDMGEPPVKVPRSRWLDEDVEEEPAEPLNKVTSLVSSISQHVSF